MTKRKWIFLSNTFEVQTRGSQRKMLSLASDTHSKLQAESSDALIGGIFSDFSPVFIAYRELHINYSIAAGNRKGKTLNLELLLLEQLHEELHQWEGAVRAVYPEDTPKEVAIFPNKRTPFFHGNYEQRILAIRVLAEKLQAEPLLSATTLQVQSFYNLVSGARNMQLQKEGLLGEMSALLENQRVLVAEALWGIVLGRLMDKYRKNPAAIEHFFDFTLLRKKRKVKEEEQLVKDLLTEQIKQHNPA